MAISRQVRVHVIHVGNMANKGTQALLKSDISVIRQIFNNDVSISVSTADVEGVRHLGLAVDYVLPTLVDIPYEVADAYAKRSGCSRASFRYKMCALLSLFNMFVQMYLSLVSAALVKAGLKSFYRENIVRCLKDSDVVLSCSDENFKESASMLPMNIYWLLTWWSMLASKTWKILVARLLRRPIVMLPNSVGPFRTVIGRELAKAALNRCVRLLVRDRQSYQIVKGLAVKSPTVLTSDTALLFETSTKSPKPRGRVVGVSPGLYSFSLNEKKINEYEQAHAEALDKAIELFDVSVVFLPHYVSGFSNDDLQISQAIFSRMQHRNNATVVDASTVDEFRALIGNLDLLVSSKMHPCVLAASAFVPSLCIAYDHKQTGLFADLGLDENVLLLQNLSSQALFSKFQNIWNTRENVREVLKVKVPQLQSLVRHSIEDALGTYVRQRMG